MSFIFIRTKSSYCLTKHASKQASKIHLDNNRILLLWLFWLLQHLEPIFCVNGCRCTTVIVSLYLFGSHSIKNSINLLATKRFEFHIFYIDLIDLICHNIVRDNITSHHIYDFMSVCRYPCHSVPPDILRIQNGV